MKNPKERTALFEEISGSGALKKDYKRLKQEVQEAEENTKETYEKKKALGLERKEAKSEKAEAEKYQKLRDNLADRQMELQQFKLFHNEPRIRECEEQCETQKKEVEKEHGKSQREFAKVDSEIREKENEIQKKQPAFIKAKEKTSHIQKKVDNAKKSLTQAKKAYKSHQSDVQELETELRANERRRDEYEEITASESQNQGRNLQLEDAQITEYHNMNGISILHRDPQTPQIPQTDRKKV
jgi:structural maintenance of chromosome 1